MSRKSFIPSLLGAIAASSLALQSQAADEFIFGVGTHHGSEPDYFSELKQAGVMSNRDDFPWGPCEKEKGVVMVPEAYGTYIDRCLANGMTTICILDYGNKLYENGSYPREPESVEAFVRYSEAVVKELKGRVKLFQVWNEWDGGCSMSGHGKGDPESYVKLIAAVYPRLKAIDPSIVVLANSICTGDDALQKTVDLGLLKHCDAVALHTYFYGDQRKTLENTWFPRMQKVDKMLRDANGGKEFPLYATEIGWPTQIDPRGSTETYSADCMAKLYLLAISFNYIKGVWWYDFRDDGWDYKYNENNFGMVRRDMTPKLSYFVFKDLTRFLKGASFVERLDAKDPQVWVMKYRKADGKTVIAAWNEAKDVDAQISFTNAAPLEFSACHLGYGSLQRSFVKSAKDSLPKFDLIVRSRPWVMEGDLDAVQVASVAKREFPESERPQKVMVKSPAAIGKAIGESNANVPPFYFFGDDSNYRCAMEGKRGGKADLDAGFSMRWNAGKLFLEVKVTDDVFCQESSGSDTWNGDGLQMAFLALGPETSSLSGHVDLDVALTKEGPKVYRQEGFGELKPGPVSDIKAAISRDASGVVYKLEIPLSSVGLPELKKGSAFGFSLLVNDNDGKGRKGYLRWGDGIGVSKDPSQYNWIVAEE